MVIAFYAGALSVCRREVYSDESFVISGGLIPGGPPMWTSENRARYDRSKLRYPSDLTDEEWALVEPLIPPRQARRRQAHGDHARGGERPDVRSLDRLSVARDPERPAAEEHGLRLFRSVDL